MKYLIVLLLLLVGCERQESTAPKRNSDPTCLDGYLVSSFTNIAVNLFCEQVYFDTRGVEGYKCSEIPFSDPKAVADVRISEGAIFPTKCFNRLHK